MQPDPKRDLAAFEQVGTSVPFQLWIGEAQVINDSAASDAAIQKYQVCALVGGTTITPFVPGTHTGAQVVIASQPASGAGVQVPYWDAGKFNHEALIWPAGTALDTYAERKALLTGTQVRIGHLV